MAVKEKTSPHLEFQAAMARYYKTERDRSEDCMARIVDVISSDSSAEDRLDRVTAVLIQHYSRGES